MSSKVKTSLQKTLLRHVTECNLQHRFDKGFEKMNSQNSLVRKPNLKMVKRFEDTSPKTTH